MNNYSTQHDNLEAHDIIMKDGGLSNLSALVTVDYASRFSHPVKVVSETGAFYLGSLGRKDILDSVNTGDTISITADQSRGLVYDLIKPSVEYERANLDGLQVIPYNTAKRMIRPPYEEIDDRLFMDKDGKVGVIFWDYNEERGIPTDVFYTLIGNGYKIGSGEYRPDRVILRHSTFPSLLDDLLTEARSKLPER